MAYQEVSHTGWFGRIGEALKGILIGLLLVAGGLVALVWNERNAVRDIRANKEIAAEVVTVDSAEVDPSHDGQLVHLHGAAMTKDVVRNERFGVEEVAIRLSWSAQIYQWVEKSSTETRKKLGGGEEKVTTYTYEKRWEDEPVDSSGFKERGHDNPTERKFQSGSSQAQDVTLGAFQLPGGLISQIRSSDPYPLETIPETLAEQGTLASGVFHTGDPARPQVGDEKVTFSLTPPGDVTVMAVQTGSTFAPYETESGKSKFLLYEGLLSADQVVEQEENKAAFLRWGLRGGGILFLFIGFSLLLRPLSVLADVVPLFGSLVGWVTGLVALLLALGTGALVIAITWVAVRPLVGIPLLLAAAACLFLVIRTMMKAKGRAAAAA